MDDEAPPPSPPDETGPATEAETRRRISPLTLLGIALLVAGLTCLGWVGYQYFGTNLVSEHAFDSETHQLRDQWNSDSKSDPDGKKQTSAIPGDAIALLRIPAFGSDFEVPILNGTELSILAKGVGHYSSTAAPGQIGPR